VTDSELVGELHPHLQQCKGNQIQTIDLTDLKKNYRERAEVTNESTDATISRSQLATLKRRCVRWLLGDPAHRRLNPLDLQLC